MLKSIIGNSKSIIGSGLVCGNHWQIPLVTMLAEIIGNLAEIIGNLASLRKYILLVKTLIKSASIHLYNMFIMHRFGITLSTCSLTWQDITTLTFANSITFEYTFLVRGPIKQGNDLRCYFRIDIYD